MSKRPLRIEFSHRRLRGGRLSISAGTTSKRLAEQRRQAVATLMERGDWDTVERLRAGQLDISDVQRAVREGDWESLRAPASESVALPPITLGQALDSELRRVEAVGAPRTAVHYATMATIALDHFGRDCDMAGVSKLAAEIFLHGARANLDAPWAPSTQRIYATFLSSVWRRAIEHEAEAAEMERRAPRLTRNPWHKVETARPQATRHAWLRPEQWRRLSAHVEGTPRHALYALGCLAGLRQQEAAHLRPGYDVDLTGRVLTIQPREGDHAWRPKTANSVRAVEFEDELAEILQEHVRRGFSGSRYLLRSPRGDRPLAKTSIADWTRADLTAVGLRYGRHEGDALTYHSLRHTFASWLAQRDVSLALIAELMGDTVETVTTYYAHLQPSNRRRGARIIDAVARGEIEL